MQAQDWGDRRLCDGRCLMTKRLLQFDLIVGMQLIPVERKKREKPRQLLGNLPPTPSLRSGPAGRQARHVVEIVEAARRAIETGRRRR